MSVLRTVLIFIFFNGFTLKIISWIVEEHEYLQSKIRYSVQFLRFRSSVFSSVPQVQEFGIQFSSSGSGVQYSVQFLRFRSSVFRNSALRPIGIQNSALDPVIGLGIDFPFPFQYSVPFKVQWFEIPAHPRFRLSAFRIRDSRLWHYVLLHWSVNRIYVPQNNMLYCRWTGACRPGPAGGA